MFKTSKIWTINLTQLQKICDKSASIVEVLKSLGLDPHSGNHRTLKKRIEQDHIDLTNLLQNQKNKIKILGFQKKIPNNKIFIQNSKFSRSNIKKRIIKENIIPYKCGNCDNGGIWMDKSLSLHLEHINGINTDHRLENLIFLCPNCHSQTDTYAGKKNKKCNNTCKNCGVKILRSSIRCKKCSSQHKGNTRRKFNISSIDLEKLLEKLNLSEIGRMYGVSSTTVKKYCIRYGLSHPI